MRLLSLVIEILDYSIQPSMINHNKYVTSLDLKMLGSKFITIPDSHLQMSTLSSIRKSKNYDLPSLLATMPDQDYSTIQGDMIQSEQKFAKYSFRKSYENELLSLHNYKSGEPYSEQQKLDIAKYRDMISRLKQDNQTIHNQIKNLYRAQKITANQPRTKPIRNIVQSVRDATVRQKRFRLSPEAKKYQQIYENLVKEDNPHRKESLQIQKSFKAATYIKILNHFYFPIAEGFHSLSKILDDM